MSRRAVATVGLCCAVFAVLAACSDTPAPAPATKTVTVPPTTGASSSTPATSRGSSSNAPGRVFDPRTMQADVRKILTETYQVREVGDVLCPSNQTVKDGSTFTCTVQVGGEGKTVTITVTGDDGRYEVGAPA
ncbi:DUF4333 domain-containing protein [Amycolatopsis decaplanina]|uniref:DUF4333 domain-containing protein n=1 Tax=Amycolatopsis decaplanina DSM 44594 TaxID=1284240 RepID=M2Y776_9PSEU|nr:DUF4333 domain-containing protein [Amycolatopsis decaplanina]EME50802.1 hypothetical protein H074_38228 [Amycolatopsis decaplanina DSM 44594]